MVVTDDELRDEKGKSANGIIDSNKSLILIQKDQSPESALMSIAHEFLEAWKYHIGHDRDTVHSALYLLAEKDADLRRNIIEGSIESQGTLLVCFLKECNRVNIQAVLAAHFGRVARGKGSDTAIILDAARAAMAAWEAAFTAAAWAELEVEDRVDDDADDAEQIDGEVEVKEFLYLPDVDGPDWQAARGQSGGRCECPACGKTINGATVAVGEGRYNIRLRGLTAPCMFICDHCKIGVRWLTSHPFDGSFDSRSMNDVEMLEGAEADKAMLAICGDPLTPKPLPFRFSETG